MKNLKENNWIIRKIDVGSKGFYGKKDIENALNEDKQCFLAAYYELARMEKSTFDFKKVDKVLAKYFDQRKKILGEWKE